MLITPKVKMPNQTNIRKGNMLYIPQLLRPSHSNEVPELATPVLSNRDTDISPMPKALGCNVVAAHWCLRVSRNRDTSQWSMHVLSACCNKAILARGLLDAGGG